MINSDMARHYNNEAAPLHVTSGRIRQRLMGFLVLAIIILPMLSAYFIYKTGIGLPSQTINKGELIIPATSLNQFSVMSLTGKKKLLLASTIDGKSKWRLIIVGDDHCVSSCSEQLYKARQVNLRLSENSHRVERILLANVVPDTAAMQRLERDYPDMDIAVINRDVWQKVFKGTNYMPQVADIVVVDQQGFAMMHYSKNHSGGEVLDDLKRLLKYSYEG